MPSLPLRSSVGAGLALALAACTPYHAGALARSATPGTAVVAAGCLDVAAAVTSDAIAAWPVVDLRFGNRCDRPVPVDLRAIDAYGHTRDGAVVRLVPYDPRAELRALPLEARSSGGEQLQYRDPRDLGVVGGEVVDLCLDLAGLGGPASGTPIVRCFPRNDAAVAMTEVAP